jgi:hypothetical protein
MNTLKSRGPRIEPCGTPFYIFAHVLTIFPILICCFLLDKKDSRSFVALSDNPYSDNLHINISCGNS